MDFKSDARCIWVCKKSCTSLSDIRNIEKFKILFLNDEALLTLVKSFITDPTVRTLFISGNEKLTYSIQPPKIIKRKSILFMKLSEITVSDDKLTQEVIAADLCAGPLEQLSFIANEIFMPILSDNDCQENWSDTIQREITEKLNTFLSNLYVMIGNTKGQTILPFPLETADAEEKKDHIHGLETAIVRWSKQINGVLKTDPEQILNSDLDPDPIVELEFWISKSKNLNSISTQISSVKMKNILEYLAKTENAFGAQFQKLAGEVEISKNEANDNSRYLGTMRALFNKLNNSNEFESICPLFHPIFHTMTLIWKKSDWFHTPLRLACLVREICNAVIKLAQSHMSAEKIFEAIEQNTPQDILKKLTSMLYVMHEFKACFEQYREKSLSFGDRAWRVPSKNLFYRLDLFIERCEDLHEFVQIVMDFSKLEKINIGGTKGFVQTNTLRDISSEFQASITNFRSAPFDLMNIKTEDFDKHFYAFKCTIKLLEPRLVSVVAVALEDCTNVISCFKVLDIFETILDRPVLVDALEPRYLVILEAAIGDINNVMEMFHAQKSNPPIHNNLPPISGALTWSKALMDRLRVTNELFSTPRFLDNRFHVSMNEMDQIYKMAVQQIEAFQQIKVNEWAAEAEISAQAKLNQPLLRRDGTSLRTNFDDALVRLLREVKYFLVLKLSVDEKALSIYRQEEIFRNHQTNLDLIVGMYNEMVSTLTTVEFPLVAKDMAALDSYFEAGLSNLSWISPSIDKYIASGLEQIRAVYQTVKTMKNNIKEIERLLKICISKPLIARKLKPVSAKDFLDSHSKLISQRKKDISEDGENYNRIINETAKLLKVDIKSPIWATYIEHVQGIIIDGLAQTISTNLNFLIEQINVESIAKKDIVPLISINLSLSAKDVSFLVAEEIEATTPAFGLINSHVSSARNSFYSSNAPIKELGSGNDVWALAHTWIDSFFGAIASLRRVDLNGSHPENFAADSPVDYAMDVSLHPSVNSLYAKLTQMLDDSKSQCEKFRTEYMKYSYLWMSDINQAFNEFLKKTVPEEDGETETYSYRPLILPDFEAQILRYKSVQNEILEKSSPLEVGWLRVNTQPIKQALCTWVGHWMVKYVSYLQNHVTEKLNGLNSFIDTVSEGIDEDVPEGNQAKLREVLSFIHSVRVRENHVNNMWDPLRNTTILLKKQGFPLEDSEIRLLDSIPQKWANIVTEVYNKQQSITSLQNAEVDHIKHNVESFTKELDAFRILFRREAPFEWTAGLDGIKNAYKLISRFSKSLDQLGTRSAQLRELEGLFGLNVSSFRDISQCRNENKFLKIIWDCTSIVYYIFESWKKILWEEIDTEELLFECKDLKNQIDDLPREVKSWKSYNGLLEQVKNLILVLPLVNILHSPNMQMRHWQELMVVTKSSFVVGPSFCLSDLLDLELHLHVDDVEEIVEKANKESKIEAQLRKIQEAWRVLVLEYVPHKHADSAVQLIKIPEEITQALEEHMVLLQGIQNQGKYVKFFADRVGVWMSNLGAVETVLRDWLEVQSTWSSLETIFLGSADIRVQLPEDSKRFDTIDADFRQLMVEAAKNPNVVESCTKSGRSNLLENLKDKLELCQKSLNNYLEAKKKVFPRFYFLSDTALLDILSNGNNPQKIQKHLADCFDNLQSLKFEIDPKTNEPTKKALGMYSKDGGEYVEFKEPFMCDGAVEDWLNGLVEIMRDTLREILVKSKEVADQWSNDSPRASWLFDYCAQIAVTTSQIMWTEEMLQAIELINANENSLREYLSKQNLQLEALISLVQGDLSPSDRVKIITLITIDVHSRDVTQALIDQKVDNPQAFAWQSQLRYFIQDKQCPIRICDAEFFYSFEFIGNPGRLVITPLTDRCYITLTQAMRLVMGGAPAGPAGTGKTETVKDLGRGMALPVYVFNCSSQMNVTSLGDIFKGLCQTGAWGCFDEFNRIPIEVLSVVSTQYLTILNALRAKSSNFDFMGEDIKLISTMGAFITMNPGYAGRTELPESLKALFRPCAMCVPDMQLICENMLFSEGFITARKLAKKMVTLYRLGSDLLSKQQQYDWGLRAIKSVLRVAGGLKRAEPKVEEEKIMMRALRDFNLPKIVDDDKNIFKRIINDLFPSLELEPKVDRKFNDWVRQCTIHNKLQAEEMFISKVVGLKELLEIRHSVFLIGPAGCGKSQVWKTLVTVFNTLERGLEESGPKVAVFDTLNPKAVTSDELFGFKTSAGEWHDGVLSVIMRDMARCNPPYTPAQKHKFIVLDGDIDPEWIESLNTVMDDNKVMTLVSNERIPLTPSMRLLFEISNLKYATPATVSRAGILYISERDIGWKPLMDSWIDAREEEKEKDQLMLLFNRYVKNNDQIEKLRKEFKYVLPVSEIQIVQTICYFLEELSEQIKKSRQSDWTPQHEKEVYECAFVFATIWAYGGPLLVDKSKNMRDEFNSWWKREFPGPVKFGENGNVFDYFPDLKTAKMVPWSQRLPAYHHGGESLVSNIYVPTIDTFRLSFVTDLLAKQRRPVCFVGNAGTGKTTLVRQYISNLSLDEYMCATINFNSFTDSYALQTAMEQYIDRRSGRTYGPPPGRKLIYFIDDLNMPFVDTYGTQSPIELLVQHLNYGSFYDRRRLEMKKDVKDCQYIACMNPTAGSFVVNDRLMRNFAVFSSIMPSASDLKIIYKSILDAHFMSFDDSIQSISEKLINATIDIVSLVSERFLPNADKFMYQFNLREMSNIVQGLCLSSGSNFENGREKMIHLWLHECLRVVSDRFVVERDIDAFKKVLSERVSKHFDDFKFDFNQTLIFTNFVPEVASIIDESKAEKAVVSHGYVPAPNYVFLKDVLTYKLNMYNDSNPNMDLVLFEMAMEHICRISRIIGTPRGNALLVGVGGSGKQSLARLASFICGYKVMQIAVTATYSINDFKAFLQDLYQRVAIKNEQLTFILTDTQIVDERFLVYINDLLSSGFIPDLFNAEERESIFQSMRKEFTENRIPDVKERMNEYFINKVRASLHLVLCFSPVGDTFRVRARKFPALINCTSMDYFHGWPRQALETVALRFLQKIDIPEELKQVVSLHMAEVHTSVIECSGMYRKQERRYNYATPKSFLELISFYQSLLEVKRGEVQKKKDRLEKGLNILRNTASDVARLKEDLQVRLVQVEEKKASAQHLIVQIGEERQKVEKQKALANIEAEKSSVIASEASLLKEECTKILDSAIPVMNRAREAVNNLDKNALVTLSSLKQPPPQCVLVTRAVLMLREGKKKSDWKDAQKMLKGVDRFLTDLKNFTPDMVLDENVAMLQEIFDEPVFNVESMMSISSAAANLCDWVINIVAYWRVWKDTVPKQESMKRASEAYEGAQAKLASVQAKVDEMERALSALNTSLEEAVAEQIAVEVEARQCTERLSLAERLVNGLQDENARWGDNVAELNRKLQNLTGDVLLSAAFVSYIGAFNQYFRNLLWQTKWLPDLINRNVPITDGVDPLKVLAGDSEIAKWKNEGLPADRISIENGAIVNNCQRWPLMIDPQLQGLKWIKSRSKNLRQVTMGGKQWLTLISQAIQNGDCVLIENIGETLDAVLDPILSRAFVKRGRTLNIKIGEDEVEFNPKFKLYLQTKLLNPHYKPEYFAQCTMINFIVTEEGLEDQLLAMVVNREKPELEERRTKLVASINQLLVDLIDLESELLEKLSNAPDDILSDISLIEGLEKTKLAAKDIQQQVVEAQVQEISINKARNEYRTVAAEGSWLYFLLIQLSAIDHMYQFSLDSFTQFFFKAMDRTSSSTDTETRVASLRDKIRIVVYTWCVRGLFEKHKLIFATQLCFKLMRKGVLSRKMDQKMLDFLLLAPKKLGIENPIDWLPKDQWAGIQKLAELEVFQNLPKDIENSPNRFKDWYNLARPESNPLPLDWRKLDETNPFAKLLVLRVLRPDRMMQAMFDFVRDTIPRGEQFVDCDSSLSFSDVLEASFADSKPTTPLFFILSAGADPILEVANMSKRMGFVNGKYWNVSLGQGQDKIAMKYLEIGHKQGHWVVLQNIHLMPKWCLELEKKLDEFAVEGSHPDFRVFLSAEPSDGIPAGILERSIKLTNEPPQGLKANLKRAFATLPRDEFEFKDNKVKSILFALCHFHAVLLERRKFGSGGFNRQYPFSTGDLVDSATVLFNYLENAGDKVPWDDLRYIFGEIMYGGHITDDLDRRLTTSYLRFYLKEDLFDEMNLFPFAESFDQKFNSPPVLPYSQYLEYIDKELAFDTPVAFGLHPNAEIGVKTDQADKLFSIMVELQPSSASGGGDEVAAVSAPTSKLEGIMEHVNRVKDIHIDTDLNLSDDDKGPFQNVFLQEITRMNDLIKEIGRSIKELELGLNGELTMSQSMESLQNALLLYRVPESWAKLAYPSLRSLGSWLANLEDRARQLSDWTREPTSIPLVVNISYLFNPQSFLTSIMQTTSQKYHLELDRLMIQTDVTKKFASEIEAPPREGAYICGLSVEGARWERETGLLGESNLKELYCEMPVINCKAISTDKKPAGDFYECPVYKTQQRGPTYVFTAQLKSKAPNPDKWVLAGVVLILDR